MNEYDTNRIFDFVKAIGFKKRKSLMKQAVTY